MATRLAIPLTGGFLAKFYIVVADADSQAWLLILVLVVTAPSVSSLPHRALAVSLVLAVLTVFLIWFGVFSSPLLHLIQSAIGSIL